MAQKIVVDPVTRIEGHLKIEVEVDNNKVVEAKSSGTLFRGIELILKGRDPRDACHIVQRICGVCPIAHGTASMLCLDDAFNVKPPTNGRIVRNLIQGANYLQSHILHFYHLAALDYVKGPETAPFIPRYEGDYRLPKDVNDKAVEHYIQALTVRKKAHEMGAIFGAKMPHVTSFTAGGVTEHVTPEKITQYKNYLQEITAFIDNVYIPDALAVTKAYDDWFTIGTGCKNMLAYGAFKLTDGDDPDGQNQFFKRGIYSKGQYGSFDKKKITEEVKYSWYDDKSTGKYPGEGATVPNPYKKEGYSWLKAPRYDGLPFEVGPLARLWVNKESNVLGLGEKAFSVHGRHFARALETSQIAHAMVEWLNQLVPGQPTYAPFDIPKEGAGVGLHEAPRGALGHWIVVKDYKIDNYQAVVPTTWNGGPRDAKKQLGPIEQALVGAPVKDPENPIELVRIVRAFDPCIACAVHVLEIKGVAKEPKKFII
ncbi:nickel-dependent hydrogenase large subunit [Pelotomaculum propionicicum]|uniref:Periplasmic (NiFeSe) hydrogenase large subunit n=1 Tax=Pelotomaculum propionicicum TaxID=258475 RepID=A0A4Y7RT44_9FIRM|nr:nickel-dependent hydrogenase large subunit [Pelotomaculum propionicicum]NLI12509.1 nickel-dependent hydrogenase large subunit [Peptococcaceae bacterium]TEB12053.1 Periplasmic (NiFeSe) hydrogenase large subunit [Pelotomaculum propionicicum]